MWEGCCTGWDWRTKEMRCEVGKAALKLEAVQKKSTWLWSFSIKLKKRKTLFSSYNTEFVVLDLSVLALHLVNYSVLFWVTPFLHLLHYSIQNGDVGWVLHRMGLKKKVRKTLKLELVFEDLLKRLIFIVQNSLRPNLDSPASRFWCQNLK